MSIFNPGTIRDIELESEMRSSYMDYAMSVIVSRALPDVRDGLKPVQRRILYAMLDQGMTAAASYEKSAAIVGEVLKTYHPHGDQSVYDALVRLAQPWVMRYPLVDGQGNFGSVDGDPAAAYRYCVTGDTRVRLAGGASVPIAELASLEPDSEVDIDVEVLDKDGRAVHASRLFHSGTHPTLRITAEGGYSLRGSHNHPVLCLVPVLGVPMLQWLRLDEITPGTVVALARNAAADDTLPTPAERRLGVLLGAWVSEGFCSQGRAGFNNTDADFFAEVLAAYDALVGGRRYVYNPRSTVTGQPLWELDVQNIEAVRRSVLADQVGLRAADKRIPEQVWRGTHGVKRAFLQALFEGDGGYVRDKRDTLRIDYSTQSERLARDVQEMLLEFGVASSLTSFAPRRAWKLYVTGKRNVRRFAAAVGFLGRKQSRLLAELATVPSSTRSLDRDFVPYIAGFIRAEAPRGGREWLSHRNIDRFERWDRDRVGILERIRDVEIIATVLPLVDAGYRYARVATVEDAEPAPVYSLRVDSEDHSFLAGGFINHNTEARMTQVAMQLVEDIDKETVDFVDNYSSKHKEPSVLPALLPNLLVNGASGIAVGMATNIPPHNLSEVCDGIVALVDNPETTTEDLTKHIKGPDFPTGGIIYSRDIATLYGTGHGRIVMRAQVDFEESKDGREQIIVHELPYQVNKSRLLTTIADLVQEKKIDGIADLRDESGRAEATRIVITLKSNARAHTVLNNLYKHSQLQTTFGGLMLALVDGRPQVLGIKAMLQHYVDYRRTVVTRRTRYELDRAKERAHILEGLMICLQHLDEVIKIIRAAVDEKTAQTSLEERFGLSDRQSKAIVDLRLGRLTRLESDKLRAEYEDLIKEIARLEDILADVRKVDALIKEEIAGLRKRFGDARRTEIRHGDVELTDEDLIPREDVFVTLTSRGYVKRQPLSHYRAQHRGGRGIVGAKKSTDEDYVAHSTIASTHSDMLFFTNQGRVFKLRTHEIPDVKRQAKGMPVQNLIDIAQGEKVTTVIAMSAFDEETFLVMVTRKGVIKKTPSARYSSVRRNGLIAMNLQGDDQLGWVKVSSGGDELLVVTRQGKGSRYSEKEVRSVGRDSMGVSAMRLRPHDEVAGFDIVRPDSYVLVVTQFGYGKLTPIDDYPVKSRNIQGVYTVDQNAIGKIGEIVGMRIVTDLSEELMVISTQGQVIRIPLEQVRISGRQTRGVIIMRLADADMVGSIEGVGTAESFEA